jgi:hypothetical protein
MQIEVILREMDILWDSEIVAITKALGNILS